MTSIPKKATREAFGEALLRCGEKYPQVVALDADLSKSTRSELFAKKLPERFFEMGIAEANMIGVGAGLALSGKVPFICSFSCFVTGRYDIIRISVAYSQANVRIVGTHAGVGIGEDGFSQQGLEDVALMRALPHMAVIQPADDLETQGAVEYLVHHRGPAFLRLTRQKVDRLNPEGYQFQFGKAVQYREGRELCIAATGGTVGPAVQAAEALARAGISARVLNFHTLKPIDRAAVIAAASECSRIVTVEDHQIIGGLGSAVAEVLAEEGVPARLHRIGLPDEFGESGSPEALLAKYDLDASGIERRCSAFVEARSPRASAVAAR